MWQAGVAIGLLLAGVAVLACSVPAYQIVRIDPAAVLRSE